jgi:hypothetical protein
MNLAAIATTPDANDFLACEYNQAFNALLNPFRCYLSLLPDTRQGSNTSYAIYDFAVSAFSVFFMQQPSFLAHQRFLEEKLRQHNLTSLFGVQQLPSDSQIRRVLDNQSPAALEPIYDALFEQLKARGEVDKLRAFNKTFLIPLDGVTYHSSTDIYCEQCNQRQDRAGTVHYSHQALFPVIVAPDNPVVISLPPEFVTPQDGQEKQDCELTAAKRWLKRHGTRYIPLGVTFLGDDLFAHQPFCQEVLALGAHFILTAKPDSHKTLYEWLTPLLETKHVTTLTITRRQGKKKWLDTYHFINQVPLRDSEDALQVNWCELTTTDAQGKVVYRNSFITDHLISCDNVIALVKAGRARWKVENENHNTLKTKGYHLSHNFGHGQRYLAQFLASLNVLAFLFHTALDCLDVAYRALRLKTGRRDMFFQSLAVLTRFHYFRSWGALMQFMLEALEMTVANTS